jgi:glyoxylase-like metal-dependent hydrolase (beta-lactamase superfamily II)
MTAFVEVADRVWVARQEWYDVNVVAVAGDTGLLVLDTHTTTSHGRAVLEDVRRLSRLPLLYAVNSHQHFDHTFGNAAFAQAGAELVAHEDVVRTLPDYADAVRREARRRIEEEGDEPDGRWEAMATTDVVLPTRTFSSVLTLDLGNRTVEVVHPGRGHTSGDSVLVVPDADVVLAGDLVEESNGAVPGFGDDCWPMEWPLALDTVLQLTRPGTVVVPGHGSPVDRDFVEEQRNRIGIVAETIRDLAARGVPLDQALDVADEWPFPREALGTAVRRAYEQLPRSQKRLPLI